MIKSSKSQIQTYTRWVRSLFKITYSHKRRRLRKYSITWHDYRHIHGAAIYTLYNYWNHNPYTCRLSTSNCLKDINCALSYSMQVHELKWNYWFNPGTALYGYYVNYYILFGGLLPCLPIWHLLMHTCKIISSTNHLN